jgi:phosphatidylserine/phosphatidylglycerophosphate/cardiolipin synthase-like enzyme
MGRKEEVEDLMKLLIQPEDGASAMLQAVRHAKKSVQVVIFRFDMNPLEQALGAAVGRGVPVKALIANTNRGGEKRLRKLEQRLLEAGVTVARTGDDLLRYHGKVLIVDDVLFVLGFNFTRLDIERSRSFGIMTKDAKLVKAACDLFECDALRQPYTANDDRLVVSPENARETLGAFITGAKRTLSIYDMNMSDPRMMKLLDQRVRAGVEIRTIGGKVKKPPEGMGVRTMTKTRLHARAIVRDGTRAFVGSQSMKRAELDQRREVGLIITDSRIAGQIQRQFDADWESAKPKVELVPPSETAEGARASAE